MSNNQLSNTNLMLKKSLSGFKDICGASALHSAVESTVAVGDKFKSIFDSLDVQSDLLMSQKMKLEAISQDVAQFKRELNEYFGQPGSLQNSIKNKSR